MPNLYDKITDKRGAFIFNGENSADFGIVVAEAPKFDKAGRKSSSFDIPGRNGSILYQEDAWSDIARTYKVWLAVDRAVELPEKVNAFTAWLNSVKGYQRLEDSFEADVYRLAYYNGGTNVSNELMQYGEATVSFTCRPERFYKSGEQTELLSNSRAIYNPTRFASKPLIHIEGSGSISLTIGDNTITAQVSDYINIDCERMNAYRLPAENRNDKIVGTFPTIAPGANLVAISGNVSKATYVPRYFTI